MEEAGLKVERAAQLELVSELEERLSDDRAWKAAFSRLTPGRQREYDLHISAAKQPTTRRGRIEKCAPAILLGKGLRD